MQAAEIGRADVHAGTAADRLEAFEDLDARCVVIGAARSLRSPRALARGRRLRLGGFFGHAGPPIKRS